MFYPLWRRISERYHIYGPESGPSPTLTLRSRLSLVDFSVSFDLTYGARAAGGFPVCHAAVLPSFRRVHTNATPPLVDTYNQYRHTSFVPNSAYMLRCAFNIDNGKATGVYPVSARQNLLKILTSVRSTSNTEFVPEARSL